MLYTALIMGLLGSVHCAAMCGPLIMAFGQTTKSMFYKLLQQFGRIIGYGFLGLLMGSISDSATLFNFEQKLSLIIGILIIVFTLFSFFKKSFNNVFTGSLVTKIQSLALQNTKLPWLRFLLLGLINSLLPCGLLFLALGTSLTMESWEKSVAFMLLFGLGTVPSLVLLLVFGNQLSQRFASFQSKVIPSLSLIVGIMMVLRGIGLGIPYLSPKMNTETNTPECCKHKTECVK
jgi:uncharacterized protein